MIINTISSDLTQSFHCGLHQAGRLLFQQCLAAITVVRVQTPFSTSRRQPVCPVVVKVLAHHYGLVENLPLKNTRLGITTSGNADATSFTSIDVDVGFVGNHEQIVVVKEKYFDVRSGAIYDLHATFGHHWIDGSEGEKCRGDYRREVHFAVQNFS